MRRLTIAATAILVALGISLSAPALAHKKGYRDTRGPNSTNPWTGGNPWSYPNCFIYSAKIKWYVWICGKPYPKEMPHR